MDNPLHIRVFCAPERAEEHLSVLASLPATFRVLETGQPDIALVGPEAASIAAGLASNARALVVLDPWAVDDIAALIRSPAAVIPVGNVLPVVSNLAPCGAALLTGSAVFVTIFTIPGVGRYFVLDAINRDYTLVMGTVVLVAIFVILFNLVVDILYGLLDPRVRHD